MRWILAIEQWPRYHRQIKPETSYAQKHECIDFLANVSDLERNEQRHRCLRPLMTNQRLPGRGSTCLTRVRALRPQAKRQGFDGGFVGGIAGKEDESPQAGRPLSAVSVASQKFRVSKIKRSGSNFRLKQEQSGRIIDFISADRISKRSL